MNKRHLFYISDGTGITAEALGHSLISQFESMEFSSETIPYVNSIELANDAAAKINAAFVEDGVAPLIFTTLVNPHIRQVLRESKGVLYDLFQAFLEPLEQELQAKSSYTIGRVHSTVHNKSYESRIDAINFALACDDGLGAQQYTKADLIIIGVSRSGKTPTSLYLALQFGVLAANYPLTEEDLHSPHLPACLQAHKSKLFGLGISAARLQAIRQERRPNSRYSSLEQCEQEVLITKRLYQFENIPSIDSTEQSIEELATKILAIKGIQRR